MNRKVWKELEAHFAEIKDVHMREMFTDDPQRFDKYSLHLDDILYDFSKNRVNDETLDLLLKLPKTELFYIPL